MALTNFISTVWSETLLSQMGKKYIAVANCNREFEGDIKGRGDRVKICGVGDITVSDYTKDTDMSAPQALSDTVMELKIDQAKFFNFQIDDVDKAQCTPKLMEAAMKSAASAMANEADKYVYSLYKNAVRNIPHSDLNDGKFLDSIIKARQVLYENNVTDNDSVILEVSPAVASVILKENLALTNNNENFENGYLGSVAGCKIYVSNNIAKVVDDLGNIAHKCLMRTKRAIAFAEQLSEIDAYRPEKRFADAVKGLHLYGAKLVYPSEMVLIDCCFPH